MLSNNTTRVQVCYYEDRLNDKRAMSEPWFAHCTTYLFYALNHIYKKGYSMCRNLLGGSMIQFISQIQDDYEPTVPVRTVLYLFLVIRKKSRKAFWCFIILFRSRTANLKKCDASFYFSDPRLPIKEFAKNRERPSAPRRTCVRIGVQGLICSKSIS